MRTCKCRCHVDRGEPVHRDSECQPAKCGCGRTPSRGPCREPELPEFPGVAKMPDARAPPRVRVDTAPDEGRPERGSKDELSWFGARIREIGRTGPQFGRRKDEYLPNLVIRANPGDRGARPIQGEFWESPDIFALADTEPSGAPLMPPEVTGVPKVGTPTTLYAHVWNLGRAPVWGAIVEFYWFNPCLGFNLESAHRIGSAMVDLGDRFTHFSDWRPARGPAGDDYLSRGCHAIVRCPVAWVPTWENGGHECLLVRVFEPFMDAVEPTNFDARSDRHIGQRNIAVVQANSPASIDLTLDVGLAAGQGRTDIEVVADEPSSMPWLSLVVGPNGVPLKHGAAKVAAGLLPATVPGGRRLALSGMSEDVVRRLLNERERFELGCSPVHVGFHARADLEKGQAVVFRIRQRMSGVLVGGYTVVLLKH